MLEIKEYERPDLSVERVAALLRCHRNHGPRAGVEFRPCRSETNGRNHPGVRTEAITHARHADIVGVLEACGASSVSIESTCSTPTMAARARCRPLKSRSLAATGAPRAVLARRSGYRAAHRRLARQRHHRHAFRRRRAVPRDACGEGRKVGVMAPEMSAAELIAVSTLPRQSSARRVASRSSISSGAKACRSAARAHRTSSAKPIAAARNSSSRGWRRRSLRWCPRGGGRGARSRGRCRLGHRSDRRHTQLPYRHPVLVRLGRARR